MMPFEALWTHRFPTRPLPLPTFATEILPLPICLEMIVNLTCRARCATGLLHSLLINRRGSIYQVSCNENKRCR